MCRAADVFPASIKTPRLSVESMLNSLASKELRRAEGLSPALPVDIAMSARNPGTKGKQAWTLREGTLGHVEGAKQANPYGDLRLTVAG